MLERLEIPLHTNGSENNIRCYDIRQKASAGMLSEVGRDCQDALLGLSRWNAADGVRT